MAMEKISPDVNLITFADRLLLVIMKEYLIRLQHQNLQFL
jgi:hypothetical protein